MAPTSRMPIAYRPPASRKWVRRAGVIEKVLWRIAREEPLMDLTTASMLKALDEKNLLREVRKQLKFSNRSSRAQPRISTSLAMRG